eukprot:GEMP01016776.1.p1 GENE.GEMP01016776.1~~GEMP01016776.1.p1  ORF type:complete len:375 (+),score=66.88 GEMP01016776.1:318-1442(+)
MGDWTAMSPDGLASQFQSMSITDPSHMGAYKGGDHDAYQGGDWAGSTYPMVPTMGMPDPTHMQSPPLTVRVEGLSFQYQFTEDDVRKVFSRYGDVASVLVGTDGASATVAFANFANGMAAWSDLNGKQLAGINGAYLRVDCPALSQPQHDTMGAWGPMAYRPQTGYNMPSYPKYTPNDNSPNFGSGQPKKFTCRLEVGIENEKEFRVGSKVIQVARKIWQELPSFQENGGKTRLRGKGVGGPHESDEPLALCISCRDPTCFEQAVQFAEAQLKKIHQEFREMCTEKGYPDPQLKDVRAVSDHPHAGSGSMAPGDDVEIDQLIEERNEARKAANYKRADEVREYLKNRGVVLMDDKGARGNKKGNQVTKWRYWNP